MKIAFRVDASIRIGSGHVMRCLTLAEELKGQGAKVHFLCREMPGHMADFISRKGFDVSVLNNPAEYSGTQNPSVAHDDWLPVTLEQDARETRDILSRHGSWDWLVVDHYALAAEWENGQKETVKRIAVIDDLADRPHACDLLLDQNFYEAIGSRYHHLVPAGCKQLLGPQYTLLRKEFAEARAELEPRPADSRRILVFFGGMDVDNMTRRTVEALLQLRRPDIHVDVIIGQSNPHHDDLKKLCATVDYVSLHIQVSNIASMMASADLAIGGGGTATWERCSVGLPALAWPIADNQKQLLIDCARHGLLYTPDFIDPEVDDIVVHIRALLDNPLLRAHIGRNGLRVIDARGAIRVARHLLSPQITLRPAGHQDMKTVFDWRNHASVRRHSRSQSPIGWEAHQNWFERVLEDPERPVLVCRLEDAEVGVVRFDITGDEAEISLYLQADAQGRGYGAAIIEAGENWLRSNRGDVRYVVAEVMSSNTASGRLFDSCGYTPSATRYRKRID